MSNSNEDYFTAMVKLLVGMGVAAVVIVFVLRMIVGAFSSSTNDMDQNAIEDRLKAIESVALVGGPAPKTPAAAEVKKVEPKPAEEKAAPAVDAVAKDAVAKDAVAKEDVADSGAIDGAALYKTKCIACHATGVAGAPTIGNKEQWAPRIAKGMDILMDTALTGSKTNPAMLPKGGASDLSEAQIKAIVEYMVSSSK